MINKEKKILFERAKVFLNNLVASIQDYNVMTNEDYEVNRNLLLEYVPEYTPKFIKDFRTKDSFTNHLMNIASGSGSWKIRREYIYSNFSPLLDYLEFEDVSKFNEATLNDGSINIILQKEIFAHVKKLLSEQNYFNAVEESYKIVRKKLKDITGKEKANDAFKSENYLIIFGHEAKDEVERDFFEGVKFLHMAIQFLRNEKAHTPAQQLDKNLAIHYIVLASLAYDLINRNC